MKNSSFHMKRVNGHEVYSLMSSDDDEDEIFQTVREVSVDPLHRPRLCSDVIQETPPSIFDIGITQCWGCEIQLDETPMTEAQDERVADTKKEKSLVHPLLRLKCCSGCEKELVAVEDAVQSILQKRNNTKKNKKNTRRGKKDDSSDNTSSSYEMDMCSGCASIAQDENEEDYDLLLCDSCPRAFCLRCVALALGDTTSAWSTADHLAQSNKVWKCIYCNPTTELVRLQQSIQQPDVDAQTETEQSDMGINGNEVVIPDSAIQKCCACDIQLDEKLITKTADERDYQPMDISTYLYSTHVHPLLRLPCCSSCVNDLVAVEHDVQSILRKRKKKNKLRNNDGSDEEENSDDASFTYEMDTCSGCAGRALDENDEDYDLLLCDSCPRTFCKRCIAIASTWSIAEDLVQSDDPWKCIYCEPTTELVRMQLPIPKPNRETDCHTDEQYLGRDIQEKETVRLLNDLLALENKYEEAALMLEETSIQNQRSLILQEMKDSSDGTTSLEKIEENAEAELASWIDVWKTHHTRLAENIGILHDILSCPEHDVDLTAFYRYINEVYVETDDEMNTDATNVKNEDEPSWKREADLALSARDKRSGYTPGVFIGASGFRGKEENYMDFDDLLECQQDDIEEINTMKEALNVQEAIVNRNGETSRLHQWGSTSFNERDIQRFKKALEAEDRELKEHHFAVTKRTIKFDLQKESASIRRQLGSHGLPRRMILRELNEYMEKGSPVQKKGPVRKFGAGKVSSRSAPPQSKVTPRRVSLETRGDSSLSKLTKGKKVQKKTNDEYECIAYPDSTLVLGQIGRKNVSIAKPIADALKEHQVSGVRFMYENICSDFHSDKSANGCILAHCMGLGKTLQTIALLHCLLTHPALVKGADQGENRTAVESPRLINRVLVIAPVNVLVNWQNELAKWVDDRAVPKVRTYVLNDMTGNASSRDKEIKKTWVSKGGILFASGETLRKFLKPLIDKKDKFVDRHAAFFSPGPDVIFIDEAHMLLKNDRTAMSKVLTMMETRRRVALTGTPLQNNLMEYYRMVNWVKPDYLGPPIDFEFDYVKPIMDSLHADATRDTMANGDRLLKELAVKLTPLINRAGSDVLLQDLKFIQQTVIHVRQSKTQIKLYRAFEKYKEEIGNNNFFFAYQNLFPVNNHPACLLEKQSHQTNQNDKLRETDELDEEVDAQATISDDASAMDDKSDHWWHDVFSKNPNFADIINGAKVLVLLHILAHADIIGDKVLLFSQSLQTLDFLEKVLQTEDWSSHAPSIDSLDPGRRWGGWKKNIDYLRIDGSTSSAKRGSLVDQFSNRGASDNGLKLFLISSKAGGVGINLVSANRVILYDSHFNPAVDAQAVFRSFRYGQEKPVFIYRLLTEGTMEEKVYSRSVNKTSLFLRAVDQKHPERNFRASELANLLETDHWVGCDACDKWRMLPPEADVANLPDNWYCRLNTYDPERSTCDAPQEDDRFYSAFFAKRYLCNDVENEPSLDSPVVEEATNESTPSNVDDAEKLDFTKRDEILSHLLDFSSKDKDGNIRMGNEKDAKMSNSLISKYYFHDSLFRDQDVIVSKCSSQSQVTVDVENDSQTLKTSPQKLASSEIPKSSTKITVDETAYLDNGSSQGQVLRIASDDGVVSEGCKRRRTCASFDTDDDGSHSTSISRFSYGSNKK